MQIKKGTTDVTLYFHLRDASDGLSKTGLLYNSTGAIASYVRTRGTRTAITLATLAAANSAHSDGGFKEVDGTNTKGLYRLDVADSAFVSGVDEVIIHIGFTDVFEESLAIELVDERPGNLKDDAITAAKIAADAIGSSEFAQAAADKVWATAMRALTDKADFALSTTAINAIADQVWDELLTGGTHNIATSAGRRLRELAAYAIESGTAQAGTATTITLAADANGGDGVFNRNLIVLVGGTGSGQTRTIADYTNATKVCVVDREWRINPDATSEYQIVADDTPLVVDHGIAQGGTSTTITLRDYASSINDTYLCNIITIIGGTGRGQARLVGSYNGTTKVATICGDNWITNPDTTSVYAIIPYGTTCTSCVGTSALGQISDDVWDEAIADHVAAGTFGVKNQKVVPSETVGDYKADVSALALEATLTAIKGSGWTSESLKVIKEYVDELESRLSATRAGYLDNLSSGAVALASVCSETRLAELAAANLPADIDLILGDTNELQTDWANDGRLDLLLDAIKTKTDDLPSGLPKNVALANFEFLMVLTSDHITVATGKTLTEEISKDGSAFSACTNNSAEVGSGVYKISLTQAEMNADIIVLKFTEASCDQRTVTILTST